MRARVNLPTPRGPVKSRACGTRPVRKAPRRAVTTRSLPRNSAKPMRSATFFRLSRYCCAEHRRHDGQHLARDFFHRAHGSSLCIEALNGDPRRAAGELIVHSRRILQMAQAGLQEILLRSGIGALRFEGDQFLGLERRNAQVQDKVLSWKVVNVVLEVFDPASKVVSFFWRNARGLMGQIGADVAVDQNDFTFVEGCLDLWFGLEAITGIKQRSEVRVHSFERAQFTVEKLAYHFAEPGIVLRKSSRVNAVPAFAGGDDAVQHIHLSAFPAAIDAFDGNESAASASIFVWAQTNLNLG